MSPSQEPIRCNVRREPEMDLGLIWGLAHILGAAILLWRCIVSRSNEESTRKVTRKEHGT